MVRTSHATPAMKARKPEKKKKSAARKAPSSWGVRSHRSTRGRPRPKTGTSEGVIDLLVSTYQSLG
jgi:hypothetical protein